MRLLRRDERSTYPVLLGGFDVILIWRVGLCRDFTYPYPKSQSSPLESDTAVSDISLQYILA